jgi:glycosyltransferase involved in cell wall biosynthesis
VQPLVSIIVPVYKVESYLKQCLDSLINQTYSNLEIIVVNDGSPDKSAEIAESYAEIDSRVHVYHKENGGLSDARNFGLPHISGDFTMFVDSDDWVSNQLVETLVSLLIENEAEAAQAGFYYAYDEQLLYDNRYFNQSSAPVTLTNQDLMEALVKNDIVKNFAWGKLYKTELVKNTPFVKGVLFEDVYWAHHVMSQVTNYVICHEPLYYYRQRADSIVKNYSIRNLDIIEGLKQRHLFLKENYPALLNESSKLLLKTELQHYRILFSLKSDPVHKREKEKIKQHILENRSLFKVSTKGDKQLSRDLHLFIIHPLLYISNLGVKKLLRPFTKPVNKPLQSISLQGSQKK